MMTENEARKLEVPIEWNGKANVCTYCGRVPETFYIVTGHDHTDDSIRWCICRDGAQYKSELEQLRQRVQELEKELERERMRLAACSTAALGYFEGCCDEYKSASLDDVLRLREANKKLTAERDFQRNEHQTWKVAHAKKCEQITTLKSALSVAKEAMQHATESWQTEDYYRGDHEDAIDSCREAIVKIYEVLNVPDGSRTA